MAGQLPIGTAPRTGGEFVGPPETLIANPPVEGPVVNGIERLVSWADGRFQDAETKLVAVKSCAQDRAEAIVQNIETKWFHAKIGFWLLVALLIAYSPPVRRLFGAKQ